MQISGERERIVNEQPAQWPWRVPISSSIIEDRRKVISYDNNGLGERDKCFLPYGEFETRKTSSLRPWHQMGVPYQKRKENESIVLSVYETERVPFIDWPRSERAIERGKRRRSHWWMQGGRHGHIDRRSMLFGIVETEENEEEERKKLA